MFDIPLLPCGNSPERPAVCPALHVLGGTSSATASTELVNNHHHHHHSACPSPGQNSLHGCIFPWTRLCWTGWDVTLQRSSQARAVLGTAPAMGCLTPCNQQPSRRTPLWPPSARTVEATGPSLTGSDLHLYSCTCACPRHIRQ